MLNYRRLTSRNVQSLKEGATDTIIAQLGQVAKGINSRFTCGGKYEVPSDKPIQLVYRQAVLVSSKEWSSVEFPGVSEVDITGKSSRRIGAVSAMIYLRSIQVDRRSRPTVSFVKLFPSAYVVGQKPAGVFV